jgi:hypothetical protein
MSERRHRRQSSQPEILTFRETLRDPFDPFDEHAAFPGPATPTELIRSPTETFRTAGSSSTSNLPYLKSRRSSIRLLRDGVEMRSDTTPPAAAPAVMSPVGVGKDILDSDSARPVGASVFVSPVAAPTLAPARRRRGQQALLPSEGADQLHRSPSRSPSPVMDMSAAPLFASMADTGRRDSAPARRGRRSFAPS